MDIQRLKSLKVLVIGDYCTDIFKFGTCERLSPEAPVPVFLFQHEIKTDGMAGNVANNLKSLNIDTTLKVSNKQTVKERYIDIKSKQHLLRTDYEVYQSDIILSAENLNKYDGIIIADYNKGSITKNVINYIIKNYTKSIFIDSKKKDLSIFDYKNCIIKINEQEFEKAIYLPKKAELIVTIGEKGALRNNVIYPTKKVEVFDVSGAGDSFISGLTVQYLLNKNIEDAIRFGNCCAANVVKKIGTSVINFEEVKHDLCF